MNKKVTIIVACSVAFSLLGFQVAFAHGNVDQRSEPAGFGASGPCQGTVLGQSFTPTRTNLIGIDMYLERIVGSPNIALEIKSGTVDGLIVGTVSKVIAAGPNRIEHFDSSLIPLTPGNKYWIMTACDFQTEFSWTEDYTGYTRGEGDGGEIPDGADYGFRTYFDPKPNIEARNISAPSSAPSSTSIVTAVTTRNTGISPVSFSVSVFLSKNNSLDDTDLPIATENVSPVAPGATKIVTVQGQIPSVPKGSYYLIAFVDPLNNISEIKENDNTASKKIAIN